MFRIAISLDCDECHQPFPSAMLTTEKYDNLRSLKWSQPADNLLALADMSGWSAYDSSELCRNCFRNLNRMAQLYHGTPV